MSTSERFGRVWLGVIIGGAGILFMSAAAGAQDVEMSAWGAGSDGATGILCAGCGSRRFF